MPYPLSYPTPPVVERESLISPQLHAIEHAHEALIQMIHSPIMSETWFDILLQGLAYMSAKQLLTSIIDGSRLVHKSATPAIYCLWITPVNTPCNFGLKDVCEHLQTQLLVSGVAVSMFHDTGEDSHGDFWDVNVAPVGPGTYMVVLKEIDLETMECIPANFSDDEKKAIQEYLLQKNAESDSAAWEMVSEEGHPTGTVEA